MDEEKKNNLIRDLGPNSKPTIFARLLAGLVDMVIMFFFHYALYSLVLITPISNNLHKYWNEMQLVKEDIKVQAEYSTEEKVDSGYSGNKLLHYNEEEDYYYIVNDIDFKEDTEAKNKAVAAFQEIIKKDDLYNDLSTSYHLHNFVVTALLCGGITELIFIFVIPIIKNNGQTLGMMICQLKMINPKYVGQARWYQHLGRWAFMFLIESCIPYFFLAEFTLLVVPLILIIILLFNKDNRTLHDFVSQVKVIDKRTFVDTTEEAVSAY
jgi:uncharacterized RDD family membrane protein YckC